MRAIESEMLSAIRNNKSWASGNTCVAQCQNGCVVSLHGNQIAECRYGIWRVTLAGWNTVTTRSRVNAIVSTFSNTYSGVRTKRDHVYLIPLDGTAIPTDDCAWIEI